GLIREERPRDHGRAGRPSLVVRPLAERVYAYAFNVEVDRIVAARVGLGGVILERREISRPRGERPAVKVEAPLAEFVSERATQVEPEAGCVGIRAAGHAPVRPPGGRLG